MTVFGNLTTKPQRGVLTYRGNPSGGFDVDAESGWYKLNETEGGDVYFKPLYGRHWEWRCNSGSVSQFIPTPKKAKR